MQTEDVVGYTQEDLSIDYKERSLEDIPVIYLCLLSDILSFGLSLDLIVPIILFIIFILLLKNPH